VFILKHRDITLHSLNCARSRFLTRLPLVILVIWNMILCRFGWYKRMQEDWYLHNCESCFYCNKYTRRPMQKLASQYKGYHVSVV